MNEKQFKYTRGSGKSLLQTAILLHETKEFNKLSIEEIYSILISGYNEQKDSSRTHNNANVQSRLKKAVKWDE